MKTEAIIIGADGVARRQEVELPGMTDTRVRIQTLIGGVSCGTESDCMSGRATYMQRPFITGYQAVGRVVEAGERAGNIREEDLVVTNGGGLWNMPHLAGGSHARETVAEATNVVKIDARIPSLATASYGVLAAVGLEGISRMKLEPGNILLVFGLGMLGQLAGRIAQQRGLRVIGVNRSEWKRQAAKVLGFDAVCPPDLTAIKSTVKDIGFGPAQYAFETTGSQEIIDLALRSLGAYGEISLGGYYPGKYIIDYDLCHGGGNLSIHNPVGPGKYLPDVISLMEAGRLNADGLIRHRIRPQDITCFYSELVNNHSNYLGAVIDWRES